jgi:hypothetical protein
VVLEQEIIMKRDWRIYLAVLTASVVLAEVGCDRPPKSESASSASAKSEPAPSASAKTEPAPSASAAQQDLLMGYELLADALADESKLDTLKFLKTLTLKGPADEVRKKMDVISKASEQRGEELEELRKLAPNVTAKPARRSPIGDAITSIAEEAGKDEMLGDSDFDLRFLLLQAQATRMIAAMATAIAKYEPNAKRKKWLTEVAREYEGYRNDIVEVLRKDVGGAGAARKKD